MRYFGGFLLLFLQGFLLGAPSMSLAEESPLALDGYLSSVKRERQTVYRPVKVVPNPLAQDKKKLQNKIFTQALTAEFRHRYREKFGHTTSEQLINLPTRYSYYNGLAWATNENFESGSFRGNYVEWYKENQRFGSFMFRRLMEYHIDKYTKDKPMVQKVYQFKEKYSRMDLNFGPKVRLKVRYEVSSNSLRLRLDNPWVNNSWLIEMDGGALAPGKIIESTLSFDLPLPFQVHLETHYKTVERSLALVGRRSLGDNTSASLAAHWHRRMYVEQSLQLSDQRENIILGGLSWNY